MLSRSVLFRPFVGARIGSRISLARSQQARTMTTPSQTPVEDSIREKLTDALAPTSLEIHNDSHLHSHHKAMQGTTSKETHFRLYITSDAFKSKMQPARHRMVYSILKDDMAREGGIHALQLKTKTPEEEEKARKLEAEAAS